MRGSIESRKWIVFHRKVGRGYRIRLCFYIAVIVLLRFWARDTQLRSVLCRPRNFERTQTNAWSGRARLEATGSARFSYRSQRLGFGPLHWPAAARGQRSRLWTALIAAPNDTGGNRVHIPRRYRCVGGEAKDKGGGFLITPGHYGVVYHLGADAKATDSAV